MIEPIFIFSLPRSGSTLLQRVLATSSCISTTSETWLLLPQLYILKKHGVVSEYWHNHVNLAAGDFCQSIPNNVEGYLESLRLFIIDLYEKNSLPNSIYFLDKTPRYSLVSDDIIRMFPNGKFVFLWRNPLSVVSSIINSWCKQKWKINKYNIDIYNGLSVMIESYKNNLSKCYTLRYEDFVCNPIIQLQKLCKYLSIDFTYDMISSFQDVKIYGRMVEYSGAKKHQSLSHKSLDIWKKTYNNQFRRHWAKEYLSWIGEERLRFMGYNYNYLLSEIKKCHGSSHISVCRDLLNMYYVMIKNYISPLNVHNKNGCLYI